MSKLKSKKNRKLNELTKPVVGRIKSVSMPQIDFVSYGLGALIVLVLILVLVLNGREAAGENLQTTMTVKRGVVELTSTGSGSIQSAKDVELEFGSGGKVTEVLVEEGDQVKKGEAIARLDSRSAELAVEQAEANLEDAENGVTTTGVAYSEENSVDLTTKVSSAAIGGGSVETQNAVYTGGESASTIYIRSDSGVSKAADEAEVEDDSGPTGETGATGPTGPVGPTGESDPTSEPEKEDGNERSPEATSGGSAGGGNVGGGSAGGSVDSSSSETAVTSAELALEEAREALRDTVLRAPFKGTIVSLNGAVGDTVNGGTSTTSSSQTSDAGSASTPTNSGGSSESTASSSTSFAVIQQLDVLEMEVSVSEADINQIHVGQRATVTISSADDQQLAAKVSNVGLLATSDSSGVVTYPVTVRIAQSSDLVRPGMSATVAIVIDQAAGGITVPNQALSGGSIEVVDGDSTESREVEPGLVGDTSTEILNGLEVGDEIAIPLASTSAAGEQGGNDSDDSASRGGFPGGGMPGGSGMPAPPSGGFPGG